MASRQSVSSILKPPKVRAPLKEIESVDQDDDDTASLPKRKVSFSGMNKIKMYNTGATSLTVHQAPMFDEQISMLSDTSNGDKTKLSGKFEKSDGQITLESTNNCTNMEENGRVIIEYNSPNENMEMTEVLSGNILSDTIFTAASNCSKHSDFSLDYSTSNMEFTGVIGQILTGDISSSSSIEMSQTLNYENTQPDNHLNCTSSGPLQDIFVNKVSNVVSNSDNFSSMNNQSCNMESTSMSLLPQKSICFNNENERPEIQLGRNSFASLQDIFVKKGSNVVSHSADLSCMNNQSSNMELTSMSLLPQKSICFNNENEQPEIQFGHTSLAPLQDIYVNKGSYVDSHFTNLSSMNNQSSNMELTSMSLLPQKSIGFNGDTSYHVDELAQLPDEQIYENYEYNHNFIDMESNLISKNSCDEILQDNILCTKSSEINKFSNYPGTNSEFECNNTVDIEKLSLSVVSMEIDSPLEVDENNISYINIDNISRVKNNYSNIIDIINPENIISSAVSMIPTSSSFVQEAFPEKNTNTSVLDENHYLKRTLLAHTSIIDQNQSPKKNMFIEIDGNQKDYCRKSIVPSSVFNQTQSKEDENISDMSAVIEDNHQKINSENSAIPSSVLDQTKSKEDNYVSDTTAIIENIQQTGYSRKSVAPSSKFDQTQSEEDDNVSYTSAIVEDNQHKGYSRKSIAPSFDCDQIQSEEDDNISGTSEIIENNQKKVYSRKSVAPSSKFDQTLYEEDDNVSHTPAIVEDNQRKGYSRKSTGPSFDHDQIQSEEYDNVSGTSEIIENNQQKVNSRKSIAPSFDYDQTQSEEDDNVSGMSAINENNQQKKYSRKSIVPSFDYDQIQSEEDDVSGTSAINENNHQKNYSRKSIAPSFDHDQIQSEEDDNVCGTSAINENNQQKKYSRKCTTPLLALNHTKPKEDDNVPNTSEIIEDYQQNEYLISTSKFDTQSKEDDNISKTYEVIEELKQKEYTGKSIALSFVNDKIQSEEDDDISGTSAIIESNQPKEYSKESAASSTVLNQTQLVEDYDFSDTSEIIEDYNRSQSVEKENASEIFEDNQQKRYSRKTKGPTSSVFTLNITSKNISVLSDNSLIEESNVSNSDKSTSSLITGVDDNIPLVSNKTHRQHLNLSNYEQKLVIKSEHQSILTIMAEDNDLNSPLRKKSRKSIDSKHLANQFVDNMSDKSTKTSFYCKENNLKNSFEENTSEDIELESKMDISIEVEPTTCNKTNISFEKSETSMALSSSSNLCNMLPTEQKLINKTNNSLSFVSDELLKHNVKSEKPSNDKHNFCELIDTLKDKKKISVVLNDLEKSKVNFTRHFSKVEDDVQMLNDQNTKTAITNENCVRDLSKLAIHDELYQKCEKSFISNVPLSCSSFMVKPNNHNCMPEDFMKESPIKNETVNKNLTVTEFLVENNIGVNIIEEECVKENLSIEVLTFLERWSTQFIKSKLDLEKCTNCEWIFNLLDNHIKLVIKYLSISDDRSYLKVKDILFITNINTENEIMKFGINWILSKYSPKFYKEICFTSKDVELLLKSLLEDIQFITAMINNMMFIKDIYFVKFKDNKAEFVLHNIKPLLMARVEVSLSNVHKLNVKDIIVDCLFGVFDKNILKKIVENITKDYNVLQSLVEELNLIYSYKKVTAE